MVLRTCKALGNFEPFVELRNKLDSDVREILKQNVQIAYFMRGAVSYDELMFKTVGERQLMSEFISERLEAQAKMPPTMVY